MSAPVSSWTPERVARLRHLAEHGHSASAIARDLGDTTRNAVISKCFRLGIQLHGTVGNGSAQRVEARAAGRVAPMPRRAASLHVVRPIFVPTPLPRPRPLVLVNVESSAKHLMELRSRHCRWPLPAAADVEPPDILYCGRQALEERPYCGDHARIAFKPPKSATADLRKSSRRYAA